MYLLILFFLFFSFLSLILFGHLVGKTYSIFISIFSILLATFISYIIFFEVIIWKYICYIKLFNWFKLGILDIYFELYFDSLSATMLLIILTVSACVHIFSIEYMSEDPDFIRFLSYLTLFTIFMLILVLSSNLVQIFLGWEGVGLSSYLLINFWYTRKEANRSAIKAVIFNRFGDFGLYLAIILIFFIFKTLDLFSIFNLIFLIYNFNFNINFFSISINIISLIALFLFLAASGKSAQLGLHVWLPDAMEGPTPVSALIHAATMVTAGVFLLIRMSPLIEFSSLVLLIIMFFGGFTAFISSTIGLVQNDIKKVIAFSTCSQLGYMMFACGTSNYIASLYHLFNHAFFKALLFLGAGSIIHSMLDEQDLRKYGSLLKILPFAYITLLIGSASLAGFPFLSGFYSKDFIIESSFSLFTLNGFFIFWLGSISVFFTSFYSFRLLYLTFFSRTNSNKKIIEKSHESSYFILISLSILIIFSIFSGFIFFDLFLGFGSDAFADSIYIFSVKNTFVLTEFLPIYIKWVPLFFSFFGLIISWYFYFYSKYILFYFFKKNYFKYLYNIISKKWYFDLLYFNLIIKNFLIFFFEVFFKIIDRGLFELIGPVGLVRLIKFISFKVNNLQKAQILYYLNIIFFISFFIILFIFLSIDYIFLSFFLTLFIKKNY